VKNKPRLARPVEYSFGGRRVAEKGRSCWKGLDFKMISRIRKVGIPLYGESRVEGGFNKRTFR